MENRILSKSIDYDLEGGVNNFIKTQSLGIESNDFIWFDSIQKEKIPIIKDDYAGIANAHLINDIPRLNKFFESVNKNLSIGQYLLVCVQTKEARKRKLFKGYPRILSSVIYGIDFILSRVLPKISFTKAFYFKVTKGKGRVLSLTECLGRLVSCGFEIVNHKEVGYLTYIISQKTTVPEFNMKPTYGALVKLNRIGKDGEFFEVYKFRTMHPYSEYLQGYVYKHNKLQDGGKFKDDFRITSWGRLFRKLWIDELPMFINFFKGEMKLFGVRPLSQHYFNLYPVELQELRKKVKPGLIPPFYSDLPSTLDEIVESEINYIYKYLDKPIRTDIKYLLKALNNIVIKRARSN